MTITVIKLGGSLLSSDELSPWLLAIQEHAKQECTVIVPGGGIFADNVRQQQTKLGFNDLTAHRLAILAMCQTGFYLEEHLDDIHLLNHSDEIHSHANTSHPLIWLPYELLQDQQTIPASWDYTSDSIALWLSHKIGAERMVLVKSAARDNQPANLKNCINNGVIDKGIQSVIELFEGKLYFFSGKDSALLSQPDWSELELATTPVR